MRGEALAQALRKGDYVFGMGVEGFGQPRWPAHFAALGLDFVFLDTEHTPLNRETAAWAAQLYAARGVAPLLRIPDPSPTYAAMGLDLGAHGIVAPYVESVEQLEGLLGAVKYRPLKGAALQRVLKSGEFPNGETADYLRDFNRDALAIIMIESPAGIERLPDLLAYEELDAVLIGPHDLSISLGVPEQYDHPRFSEAVESIFGMCSARGKGVGIHYTSGSIERALRWTGWGANLILHRVDTLYVAEAIVSEIGRLRAELTGVDASSGVIVGASGHGK